MTMRSLSDVLVEELDPETQAVCDAVCGALAAVVTDDPWAEPDYRGLPSFGWKWGIAFEKCGDPVCRQRILDAMEQRTRNDPDLFFETSGHIVTREVIGTYQGRIQYEPGTHRQILQWPTGFYAGGAPCYDRKDVA